MTTTPTAANDNKHPIVQWLPFLHKMARRLEPREQDREDLVQETVAMCLHRWPSYNRDESLPGWLILNMRESARRLRKQRSVRACGLDDTVAQPSVPARQEGIVELAKVTTRLATRNGGILMRFAMGDDGEAIAADEGISRQRVNQIVKREREKLEAA